MKSKTTSARSPGWLAKTAARRTVLGGFGAAALTGASAVFGSESAQAFDDACCHLAYSPGSYSACMSGSHYSWSCQFTQTVYCGCCERKRSNGSYYASAYRCEHV